MVAIDAICQVVICGAGPVGVTLANLLGAQGIHVLVVDVEPDILNIPRAVGICEEGSRILDQAGLLNPDAVSLQEIRNIHFTDASGASVFHVNTEHRNNGYLTQRTFHQPQLEQNLRKGLSRYPNVHLHVSTELVGFTDQQDGVLVELKVGDQIHNVSCQYLVGCDGSKSPIRKALNLSFTGKTYAQDWLIIDVANNPILDDEIFFSIDPERPGITLPLPNGRRRWEFVVKDNDTPAQLFDDAFLTSLLAPWGDLDQMQVERKAIYTFHARTAPSFQKGRVFLAGDAAHITPPFAGQGMMAGLRDAQNLAWKVAGVLRGELTPELLSSYTTERKPQCHQVINFAQMIGSFVLPQDRLRAAIRDSFIKLFKLVGFYRPEEGARLDRVPNHINGNWWRNQRVTRKLGTGVWIELANVSCSSGLSEQKESRPLDKWLGPSFYVLGWQQDPSSYLSDATLRNWRQMGGDFVSLGADQCSSVPVDLVDDEGVYADYFDNWPVVVLRPDRMVLARTNWQHLEQVLVECINQMGAGVKSPSHG
ncbi:MAG: FAD-dependent monooxygenase [Pseudomonadota bacterium]